VLLFLYTLYHSSFMLSLCSPATLLCCTSCLLLCCNSCSICYHTSYTLASPFTLGLLRALPLKEKNIN